MRHSSRLAADTSSSRHAQRETILYAVWQHVLPHLNRKQQLLFPPSIDEYVSENNPVRVVDSYVEMLDMVGLGFTKASLASAEGQPAYHPKLLLKIYLYGYLNKIRSSRKLEAEIKRNIEMMWLCSGLTPSYKTIADFRKENGKALKKVFREFVLLCKSIGVIEGKVVAIDGAFLRANASKNQLLMKTSLQKDIAAIDEKIEVYLQALAFEDAKAKRDHALKPISPDKIQSLQMRKAKLDQDLRFLEEKGLTQYNRSDPDAKLMRKPAHNLMAYNSQIAVDSTFKFIVATEVSSENNDFGKLHTMASKAKENTMQEDIEVIADAGYYSAKELQKCEADKIKAFVAIPDKQNKAKKEEVFAQDDFYYDSTKDCFICPNGKALHKSPSFNTKKDGTLYYFYRAGSKVCKACPLKTQCIPEHTPYKNLSVSQYYQTIHAHKATMQTSLAKEKMKLRTSLAEHPFGTIKQNLGWSHYLVRGIEKVSGENALIMLTYNFKRLLNLIGTPLFQKLIQAIKKGDIEAIIQEIEAHIARFRVYLFYALKWHRTHVALFLEKLGFAGRKRETLAGLI